MNALAKHSSGVYILPSPSILNGYPRATPEVMENLLNAMRTSFNYVIVDGGQSMENPALKAIEMSDYIFLITLLSLPCVHNTNNLLKSLENAKVIQKERLKLIINRFIKNSDISIKEAEDSLNSQIFWKIPNDYKTSMSAINRGKPLYEVSPKASITKSISGLADTLIAGTHKEEKKGWLFFRR
jgi:pilus assembly protein CpaE